MLKVHFVRLSLNANRFLLSPQPPPIDLEIVWSTVNDLLNDWPFINKVLMSHSERLLQSAFHATFHGLDG